MKKKCKHNMHHVGADDFEFSRYYIFCCSKCRYQIAQRVKNDIVVKTGVMI